MSDPFGIVSSPDKEPLTINKRKIPKVKYWIAIIFATIILITIISIFAKLASINQKLRELEENCQTPSHAEKFQKIKAHNSEYETPDALVSVKRQMERLEMTLIDLKSLEDNLSTEIAYQESVMRLVLHSHVELHDAFSELYDHVTELNAKIVSKSSIELPHQFTYIWKLDILTLLKREANGSITPSIRSEYFYSHEFGYKLGLRVTQSEKEKNLTVHLEVMEGVWDDILEWPVNFKADINLLDQRNGQKIISSNVDSIEGVIDLPVNEFNVIGRKSFVFYNNEAMFVTLGMEIFNLSVVP